MSNAAYDPASATALSTAPRELILHSTEGMARWLGPFLPWALRMLSMVEEPLENMSGPLTPVRGYFRRDRHRHPNVNPETYRLNVTGVARSRVFTLSDLERLPWEDRILVMECAGNGNHLQGSAGLIGQARWSGPSLKTVLDACGGPGSATHFAFRGLDPIPLIRRGYHYGLSLDEVTQADALLALRMNGEPLPRARGFPVRLVVPGIYSMSHVKWLGHIEGKTSQHRGFHNDWVFVNHERQHGRWVPVQARWIGLKSMITRCQTAEEGWRLTGWAWGGGKTIDRVAISTDNGSTWNDAVVHQPSDSFIRDFGLRPSDIHHAWSVFHYTWRHPRPGRYRITSRAFATDGTEQPMEQDPRVHGHFNQTRVKWRYVDVP